MSDNSTTLTGLYESLSAVFAREALDWEWIVVDNHSNDATPQAVETLVARDARVRGVRLARQQSRSAAILCGFDESNGDCAVVIAADGRQAAEAVAELLRRWKAGAQIVWALARGGAPRPSDPLVRLHDIFLSRVVGVSDGAIQAKFFLADRRVVMTARKFRHHADVHSLMASLGFRQDTVEYDAPANHAAPPATKLAQLTGLVDAITAFSDLPMRIGAAVGVLVLAAGLLSFVLSFLGVSIRNLSPGWMLLLSAILIAGGLNLCLLGLFGQYLWRALEQGRDQPAYVVESRVEQSQRSVAEIPHAAGPA